MTKIETTTLTTFRSKCEAQGVEPFRTLAEALDEVGTDGDRAELAALTELRDVTPTGTFTATLAYVSKLRETIRAHAEKPAPVQVVRRAVTGPFGLSKRELEICAETKCSPKMFATLKARTAKK